MRRRSDLSVRALAAGMLPLLLMACTGETGERSSPAARSSSPEPTSAPSSAQPAAPSSAPVALTGPPLSSASAAAPQDAAATWRVARGEQPDSADERFAAEVSRLACDSGVTGRALPPTVEERPSRIVVTFRVAPANSRVAGCQGNSLVRATVELAAPIGEREIVDGACLPGGAAVTTSLCRSGGVRFAP